MITVDFKPSDPFWGSMFEAEGWAFWGGHSFRNMVVLAHTRLNEAFKHVCNFETCVDVGACFGLYSYFMALRFENMVAFEPFAKNVEAYKHNMKHFASRCRIQLYPWGLSDVNEGREMICTVDGQSTYSKERGEVKFVRFDEMNIKSLDFMKVDAEGMDLKVLRGAAETIRKFKPVIMVEDTRTRESKPRAEREHSEWYQADEIPDFLKTLGYECVEKMGIDFVYAAKKRTVRRGKLKDAK